MSEIKTGSPEVLNIDEDRVQAVQAKADEVYGLSELMKHIVIRKREKFQEFTDMFEPGQEYSVDLDTFLLYITGPAANAKEQIDVSNEIYKHGGRLNMFNVGQPTVIRTLKRLDNMNGVAGLMSCDIERQDPDTIGWVSVFDDGKSSLRYVVGKEQADDGTEYRTGKIEVAVSSVPVDGEEYRMGNYTPEMSANLNPAKIYGCRVAEKMEACERFSVRSAYYDKVKICIGANEIKKGFSSPFSKILLKQLGIPDYK